MKKLESKKIDELFNSCFFEDDEIINGRPIGEFTSVQSINPNVNITVGLSTRKLNNNKNDIIEYLDSLPKIDEGNNLDNLYFDKDGNKWCDDIKILDQLMMMALACELVSYTTIKVKEGKVIIVKRNRENDNLEVKGINPEVIPETKNNQLSKGYTEEEKSLIAKNKIRITQELKEYNEVMNVGLGFFGIHVLVSDKVENQLDFYDNENNLLFSKHFEDTDGLVGLGAILNQRLSCEFKDKFENEITYLVDESRHIFLLNSTSDYGYRIEITKDNNKGRYSRILVYTEDANADYIIKRIDIDDKDLIIELNNQFGPHGNYEDGEKRYLWYRKALFPSDASDALLFVTEAEWPEKGHHLVGDCFGIKVDGKKVIGELSLAQFYTVAKNIATHPRNKELVLYAIEEVEKQLPGVKEFICNNFHLYNFIVNSEYRPNIWTPTTDEIMQTIIHEKCNLKEPGKSMVKKGNKN